MLRCYAMQCYAHAMPCCTVVSKRKKNGCRSKDRMCVPCTLDKSLPPSLTSPTKFYSSQSSVHAYSCTAKHLLSIRNLMSAAHVSSAKSNTSLRHHHVSTLARGARSDSHESDVEAGVAGSNLGTIGGADGLAGGGASAG